MLEEARALGFLGPGAVGRHLAHAAAFVAAVGKLFPGPGLDLGSGGGVPGLVLATTFVEAPWVLLEGNRRRASFLQAAVAELGFAPRVTVRHERAEAAGRDPLLRARFPVVTARSFGPPALTAECGCVFLAPGGRLMVSEPPPPEPPPPEPPPSEPPRWPVEGLATLGLADRGVVSAGSGSVRVLELVGPVPTDAPRAGRELRRRPRW